MLPRQSISKNIRWLAGANILVKPIWFLFLLASARILGPLEFGNYMYALSFLAVIAVFFEGGLDILLVRDIALSPESYSKFFSHSYFLKVIFAIMVAVVANTVALAFDYSTETRILVLIASMYNMFNSLMLHFRSVFRAFEVMQFEALSIIFEKGFVIIICGLSLIVAPNASVFMLTFTFAYLLASVGTLTILRLKFSIPKLNIDIKYLWTNVLKPALPFALMNIFIVIYFRSGTLILDNLTHDKQLVGYYNAGFRLIESFMLFPTILVAPIYPAFSRLKDDKNAISPLLFNAARILLFVSIVIALPILLFRYEITLLLFGEGYASAADSVGIITLAMIPISITFIAGNLVAAVGRQMKANIFILVATILNVILNYSLIPFWGVEGAALVTVFTELILALSNVWLVRDYFSKTKIFVVLLKSMIILIIVFGLKYFHILQGSFVVQIIITMIVLITAFFYFRIITVSDVKKIVKF
jgi:O-antigen/teichoic acid export membrane protein